MILKWLLKRISKNYFQNSFVLHSTREFPTLSFYYLWDEDTILILYCF